MILQSTAPNYPSFSSTLSYSLSFPSGSAFLAPLPLRRERAHHWIKCSYSRSRSQVNRYRNRTGDYGRRPMVAWNDIYMRVANPGPDGVASVLDQIEKEGKKFTKWELSRIVRDLKKSWRHTLALQVYEWMNKRMARFGICGGDTAIQLDLIAKVRGLSSAEEYFLRIPDMLKDDRIYGALLNAYVGAKVRDKAEALMVQMRNNGCANSPYPFNVMMTLYRELNEYDLVEELVSEMRNKGIRLDVCSYNIWLSSRGSQGSAEGMEDVFRQMQSDSTTDPDWTTFSTMAGLYIRLGQLEKAEQFVKYFELSIKGQGRKPYHLLITLSGRMGNKEEVYRVWNMYKSTFRSIPDRDYHTVISSLIRLGDVEGAEKIYKDWLLMKARYDPKIAHMEEGSISEAFEEAAFTNGADNWKPKPTNIPSFLELQEKAADAGSKAGELGCFQDRSMAGESGGEVGDGFEQLMPDNRPADDDETEETVSAESEMLPSVA